MPLKCLILWPHEKNCDVKNVWAHVINSPWQCVWPYSATAVYRRINIGDSMKIDATWRVRVIRQRFVAETRKFWRTNIRPFLQHQVMFNIRVTKKGKWFIVIVIVIGCNCSKRCRRRKNRRCSLNKTICFRAHVLASLAILVRCWIPQLT